MIELLAGLVGLILFFVFVLIAVAVAGVVIARVRKSSIVPRSTKRAVDQKIETVYRDKQVREVIGDLAKAEGWELEE